MYFCCYCCNFKFPLDYNGENWHFLISHYSILTELFLDMFVEKSSTKRNFYVCKFLILMYCHGIWKAKNAELRFYSCSLRWAIVAYGPLVLLRHVHNIASV